MNRRLISFLVIVILLTFTSGLSLKSQTVKAEPRTIYIRADGSIDPLDAPISTTDNITYILTGDIISDADGIVIERNNLTIDGSGYAVQGGSFYDFAGIDLTGRSNVTIKNMNISMFRHDILLDSSLNNNVIGNNISLGSYGISLNSSSSNSISGNNMALNYCSIYLNSSSNNNAGGNSMTNCSWGILLESSLNNSLSENNIVVNGLHSYGISLLRSSNHNSINGNNIVNNSDGIWLEYSSNNNISGNTIVNSSDGIFLSSSSSNSISNNNIMDSIYGIDIYPSFNNTIYHNNMIRNQYPVGRELQSRNIWDNGYPSGGNYWSDYSGVDWKSGPYQNETGSDGIGDTSYSVGVESWDPYPLMGMFNSFNVSWIDSGYIVDLISNSTISGFDVGVWIEHPEVRIIMFNVTGETDTVGFCRICIPTALMNGTYGVSINGTEVSYNLLSCSDANTSYLYFNYTHSTQEVIIIPESLSFLTLPLFISTTLLAAISYRKKKEKS